MSWSNLEGWWQGAFSALKTRVVELEEQHREAVAAVADVRRAVGAVEGYYPRADKRRLLACRYKIFA